MRADKVFLFAIIAVLFVLSVFVVLPYAQFVLGAVVLAFVLQPLQIRLADRSSETVAAASLVVLSVLGILFPFFVVAAFIAGDLVRYARAIEEGDVDLGQFEDRVEEYTGLDVDAQELARSGAEQISEFAVGGAFTAFEATVHVVIGLGLLLFLLFFLLRDGNRLVAWLHEMAPLPPTVADELQARTRAITKAVLVGHVLVAVIQGVIAGLGLAVVGIPNVVFWTFVMILLALIPLIGTFAVWAPASLYLVLQDQLIPGIGLFVYGAVVVGISDEYLRPIIVDRYAKISPGIIIIGVIGGLTAFGFMGLFFGPIIVGALKGVVEVYDDKYGHLDSGTHS